MGSVSLVGANTGNWTFSSEKLEFPALILPFTFYTWFSMKQTLPVLFTPSNLKLLIIFFSPVCVNSLHVSCRFEKATLMMANYHLRKGACVKIAFVNANITNILFLILDIIFAKRMIWWDTQHVYRELVLLFGMLNGHKSDIIKKARNVFGCWWYFLMVSKYLIRTNI